MYIQARLSNSSTHLKADTDSDSLRLKVPKCICAQILYNCDHFLPLTFKIFFFFLLGFIVSSRIVFLGKWKWMETRTNEIVLGGLTTSKGRASLSTVQTRKLAITVTIQNIEFTIM